MGKKLKFGLLALPVMALAVLALSVGTAAAGAGAQVVPNNPLWTADDPQTANIPYLAWAGNQVRIAKCFDEEEANGDIEALVDLPGSRPSAAASSASRTGAASS